MKSIGKIDVKDDVFVVVVKRRKKFVGEKCLKNFKISQHTGVIGFLPFLSLCETKMSTFTVVDKTKFIPQKR